MVGTDPKKGSATTTIPTLLIPVRYVFENGLVLDAGTDMLSNGQRTIDAIIDSPIFQPANFIVGDVSVGNTQFGDAFQRANFWNVVSRQSRDYHVLLGEPTIAPTYEMFIPADLGSISYHGVFPWISMDGDFLREHVLNAVQQSGVSPQTLPIVLLGPFGNSEGRRPFRDTHGAYEVPGGVQTYVVSVSGGIPGFEGMLGNEALTLSRAILNWLNNPFNDNFTPGWNPPDLHIPFPRCESNRTLSDQLEVVDATAFGGTGGGFVTTPSGVIYSLGDGAFLDYFTRATPSRSVNGQYAFFFSPISPSPPCTGHVEVEMTVLEYPDALGTTARGIDKRGQIVGSFRSLTDDGFFVISHGFIYDGANFTRLDHPSGVLGTIASKLNDAGQVVGWYFDADGLPHGFSYFQGTFTPIDVPGSLDGTSLALGINSRGDVVGLYDATAEITHGFLYRNGQYFTLDTPFGQQAQAFGINDTGLIVGDTYDDPFEGPVHGFLRDRDGFRQFDFPDALNTSTYAVNDRGMHGGIVFVPDQDLFVQRRGYVTIYGYPYEVYANVFGMNDRRRIVGSFVDPDSGRTVGYVATLPK